MLHVHTYVGESEVHGKGLFAAVPIKKGALIWEFSIHIDRALTPDEIDALPEEEQKRILNLAYFTRDQLYLLCGDNAVYINHSDSPNTVCVDFDADGHGRTYAARDIEAGDEILENYYAYEDPRRIASSGIPPGNAKPEIAA